MRFHTSCLLSKWGFNDGDKLLDFLYDNLPDVDFDQHAVLIEVVKRYVLPELKHSFSIVEMNTCHNPIRISVLDGVDMICVWDNSTQSNAVKLDPPFVDVPEEKILEIAQELCKKQ